MSTGFNYYWRLAATGSCFAAFGIGGLALSTLVFPVLLLTPRRTRAQRARRVIHKSFRLFMWMMEALGIMRLELIGGEKLHRCDGMLVLANHPTLIDVVALISLMPAASCVVKQALWRNPFLGGVVRTANYISNAEAQGLIDECVLDLAAGNPLIIFPEGTRTPARQAAMLSARRLLHRAEERRADPAGANLLQSDDADQARKVVPDPAPPFSSTHRGPRCP